MLRILHLADLHLGYRPSKSDIPKQVFDDRDKVLEQAVDIALQQGVHLAIIAGDLFDNHKPDEGIVEKTIQCLGRLVQNGVVCITVPGNHDELTYPDCVYHTYKLRWPGILVTSRVPKVVYSGIINGVHVNVCAMAYVGGETNVHEPLRDIPECTNESVNIAALHGTVEGYKDDERSMRIDLRVLSRAGYDYVALGHLHVSKRYEERRTVAYYPGMIAGKGFWDPGVGYVSLIELQSGQLDIKEHRMAVPLWHQTEVDVSSCNTYEDLISVCKKRLEQLPNPEQFVEQISLYGFRQFEIPWDRLQAELAGWCRYVDLLDCTEGFSEEYLKTIEQEKTIRGVFVRRLRAKNEMCKDDHQRRLLQRAMVLGIQAFRDSGGDEEWQRLLSRGSD